MCRYSRDRSCVITFVRLRRLGEKILFVPRTGEAQSTALFGRVFWICVRRSGVHVSSSCRRALGRVSARLELELTLVIYNLCNMMSPFLNSHHSMLVCNDRSALSARATALLCGVSVLVLV